MPLTLAGWWFWARAQNLRGALIRRDYLHRAQLLPHRRGDDGGQPADSRRHGGRADGARGPTAAAQRSEQRGRQRGVGGEPAGVAMPHRTWVDAFIMRSLFVINFQLPQVQGGGRKDREEVGGLDRPAMLTSATREQIKSPAAASVAPETFPCPHACLPPKHGQAEEAPLPSRPWSPSQPTRRPCPGPAAAATCLAFFSLFSSCSRWHFSSPPLKPPAVNPPPRRAFRWCLNQAQTAPCSRWRTARLCWCTSRKATQSFLDRFCLPCRPPPTRPRSQTTSGTGLLRRQRRTARTRSGSKARVRPRRFSAVSATTPRPPYVTPVDVGARCT
jgi:hypothetical protein